MTDYPALLREIAVPRLVGTANHQKVREVLKRELVARGFKVEEHAFSGRPSRAFFGAPPFIKGVNLIAPPVSPLRSAQGRLSARPPVWLVAHYDSKGQPISMALRLFGVFALVVGLLGLPLQPVAGLLIAAVGIGIFSRNRVTDNSPGAIDNASAILTVFMTLDRLPEGSHVGVIFPDAEEFGLVGARMLAQERRELLTDGAIVNLDGIDDTGTPVLFVHRAGDIGRTVARELGASRRPWLPVIVDGLALRRAARECVTILKGDWKTMLLVHTPRDRAERLTLTGAEEVAAGLARALARP